MSKPWITHLSREEPDGWDLEGDGMPGVMLFGNAVQVWAIAQGRKVTVVEAAEVFNVGIEVLIEAVVEHPWMSIGTGNTIEHDGE